MSEQAPAIGPGTRVRLHLEIQLPDGTQVLSTFDEQPLAFRFGDGTLTAGLEQALQGLCAGEDACLLLDGAAIYGAREQAKIHWMPRADFPTNLEPEPGQVIAFTTPGGDELAGIVVALDGQHVQVDFNHPLAGRSLTVRAQVLAVRAATDSSA